LLVALACFAAPLALIPLARSQVTAAGAGRALWEPVESYPGGAVRQLALGRLGKADALYAVSASGGLVASVDGGATWNYANAGLPRGHLQSLRLVALVVDTNDPGVLYAAVESLGMAPRPMLYWTVDGGLHWQPRAKLGRERVRALAMDAEGRLYIATPTDLRCAVLRHVSDSALSAQERHERGHDDLSYPVLAAFERQREVVSLTVGFGAAGEDDAQTIALVGTRGRGLLQVLAAVDAAEGADSRYVRERATVSAGAVLAGATTQLFAGTERGLFVSDDGGRRWMRVAGAPGETRITSLLAPASRPNTLYVGGVGGVWISRDAGGSWEPLGDGLGRAAVLALALDERNGPAVLYAATNGGLWRLRGTAY
jgi:ligand-binding sensor domain-containing protein